MPEGLLKAAIAGLSTLIAFAIMAVMAQLVGGGMKREDGKIFLRYGGFVRGLAVFIGLSIVASLLGYVLDLFTGWLGPQQGNVNSLLILAGVSALFGIPLIIEVMCRQIVLTDEGLIHQGPFGTDPLIKWLDIVKVGHSSFDGAYYVKTPSTELSINAYFDGLKAFSSECKLRLDPEVYGDAFGQE